MDGWAPENSWSDFLGVWNEASEVVAQHLWIDAWRLGGTDRCVRFLAVGKKPQADGDRAKNVDAAWKSAGFRGAPGIQIELQRGRTTAAVVYLAKNEPGALIVSAIPGPGDHWLDRLDVSFHWRTPTYVRVDASGKREIRTMAPLPDPMDKNPLKCR